jgi:hypothetical protein
MEKLRKDLFQDTQLENKETAYSGANPCATQIGGTVTRCCGGGGCYLDVGQ